MISASSLAEDHVSHNFIRVLEPAKLRKRAAPNKVIRRTSLPIEVWRGLVESDSAKTVIARSKPVPNPDEVWQHPLPEDKLMRLQAARRSQLGDISDTARQHCMW